MRLEILTQSIHVELCDGVTRATRAALRLCYGFVTQSGPTGEEAPDLDVRVETSSGDRSLVVSSSETDPLHADNEWELIPLVDEQIVVGLQHLRPDLLFLHAAVVERGGRAILLVAASGSGKSTTAWGLVNMGFGFVSDELAPIDLRHATVEPFPRALCLKDEPPTGFRHGLVAHGGRFYARDDTLEVAASGAMPIGALVFLRYSPRHGAPCIEALTPAGAMARLAPETLNLLAHNDYGLDALETVSGCCPAFSLQSADLAGSCSLLRDTLDGRL